MEPEYVRGTLGFWGNVVGWPAWYRPGSGAFWTELSPTHHIAHKDEGTNYIHEIAYTIVHKDEGTNYCTMRRVHGA